MWVWAFPYWNACCGCDLQACNSSIVLYVEGARGQTCFMCMVAVLWLERSKIWWFRVCLMAAVDH